MKISRDILHHKLNNRKNFQIYQLTICWLMIFFPDLPLHATSPSRWKWAAVSHRSLASWSIKRLSPPVQLLLVSMICTVPVIDQFCDSVCKWFRIAQLAVSVCSQGFQFPAAIVDQLVHERWKNGIFHRSRLPRWRGRRNLIKIGEVSLSGGPSNQLDDKWSPFRSNGSFWKKWAATMYSGRIGSQWTRWWCTLWS